MSYRRRLQNLADRVAAIQQSGTCRACGRPWGSTDLRYPLFAGEDLPPVADPCGVCGGGPAPGDCRHPSTDRETLEFIQAAWRDFYADPINTPAPDVAA